MKLIRAILFWLAIGIGGLFVLWIVIVMGTGFYLIKKSDSSFAQEHFATLISTWDRKAIESDLDTQYGVAWTSNMRAGLEEMLKTKSTPAELDQLLAKASQTFGSYQDKIVSVCIPMDKGEDKNSGKRFCQAVPKFTSGAARLIMTLRPNPEGDKAHRYKITGIYIEHPYIGKAR